MSGTGDPVRHEDALGTMTVRHPRRETPNVAPLDRATRAIVRLAAAVTAGSELDIRRACTEAARDADPVEAEEVLLQSYLFAGFPRTLNSMREWRRASGRPAPAADDDAHATPAQIDEWRERGEETCGTVYGDVYEPLKRNVRALHPALESWMIVDGYGKVLGRPGLSLARRELCVVAACAAAEQDRQLHAHLHGAVRAGAHASDVVATLQAVADMLGEARLDACLRLWHKVQAQ
jgi:4-carboxymuconolactone decarboxylase